MQWTQDGPYNGVPLHPRGPCTETRDVCGASPYLALRVDGCAGKDPSERVALDPTLFKLLVMRKTMGSDAQLSALSSQVRCLVGYVGEKFRKAGSLSRFNLTEDNGLPLAHMCPILPLVWGLCLRMEDMHG
jgi:hypothetical protein